MDSITNAPNERPLPRGPARWPVQSRRPRRIDFPPTPRIGAIVVDRNEDTVENGVRRPRRRSELRHHAFGRHHPPNADRQDPGACATRADGAPAVGPYKPVHLELGTRTGREAVASLARGNVHDRETSGIAVVLIHDPGRLRGFRIHTAYPMNFD